MTMATTTMLKSLTSTSTRRLSQLHPSSRTLHTTSTLSTTNYDKSDDRTSLHPERSESTQSGTDSEVAGHSSAYDPSKTSPESEMAASAEESKHEGKTSNPLDVSAANKDVGHARDPKEGGADRNVDKPGPSSRGWTRKHRVVNTDKTRAE